MGDENNGWDAYQKLVLSDLRRLDESVEKLGTRIESAIKHERGNRQVVENATTVELRRIALEVHGLKIKAGVWGMLGGLLPVIAALLMKQI